MHKCDLSMNTFPLTRRGFFTTAAAGTGMALAANVLAPSGAAAPHVKRNGKSHMKLSLAAYSFRKYLKEAKPPTMSLDDFIRLCADLNLDGTELTSYYFPDDFNEDYLLHIKELTFRLGLDISERQSLTISASCRERRATSRWPTPANGSITPPSWAPRSSAFSPDMCRRATANRRQSTAAPRGSTKHSITPRRKGSFWPSRTTAESLRLRHR